MPQNQEFFVTAGFEHLKFWYTGELQASFSKSPKPSSSGAIPMMESKSADLSKIKNKVFVGVACLGLYIYTLSIDGTLYQFDRERKLVKYLSSKIDRVLTLSASMDLLFIGGVDGNLRVVNVRSFELINVTFPKPPPLGMADYFLTGREFPKPK